MANHLLSMSKLHTLISLYVSGKPKRHIALSIGVARNTIDNYLGFLKAEVGEDLSPLLSNVNLINSSILFIFVPQKIWVHQKSFTILLF